MVKKKQKLGGNGAEAKRLKCINAEQFDKDKTIEAFLTMPENK
ncbi:18242_t:CDS:2 [Racocetra fulgida]|uniref:18242_t:CDS:1 n=1 Tax=Racocetra fulgida TaxID=60492 RepID=A0A9N8ZDR6_9GLOM|nr:18242_t:CDS:2 [Racocetra fulgida]